MTATSPPTAAGRRFDLVYGAKAIAAMLNVKPRTVYHLAELYEAGKGRIAIVNEPGLGLVASRATLRRYLEQRLGAVEEVVNES